MRAILLLYALAPAPSDEINFEGPIKFNSMEECEAKAQIFLMMQPVHPQHGEPVQYVCHPVRRVKGNLL